MNMPEQLPQVGHRGVLEPCALLLGHGAGGNLTHRVKERVEVGLVAAFVMPSKHRATGDEHSGNVETRRGDEHAGKRFCRKRGMSTH